MVRLLFYSLDPLSDDGIGDFYLQYPYLYPMPYSFLLPFTFNILALHCALLPLPHTFNYLVLYTSSNPSILRMPLYLHLFRHIYGKKDRDRKDVFCVTCLFAALFVCCLCMYLYMSICSCVFPVWLLHCSFLTEHIYHHLYNMTVLYIHTILCFLPFCVLCFVCLSILTCVLYLHTVFYDYDVAIFRALCLPVLSVPYLFCHPHTTISLLPRTLHNSQPPPSLPTPLHPHYPRLHLYHYLRYSSAVYFCI